MKYQKNGLNYWKTTIRNTIYLNFKSRLDFSFEDKLNAGGVLKYELPEGTYAKAEDIDSDNSSLGDGITGKLVYDSTNNVLNITLLNDVEAQSSGGLLFKSWFAETISETPYTLKYPIKN